MDYRISDSGLSSSDYQILDMTVNYNTISQNTTVYVKINVTGGSVLDPIRIQYFTSVWIRIPPPCQHLNVVLSQVFFSFYLKKIRVGDNTNRYVP